MRTILNKRRLGVAAAALAFAVVPMAPVSADAPVTVTAEGTAHLGNGFTATGPGCFAGTGVEVGADTKYPKTGAVFAGFTYSHTAAAGTATGNVQVPWHGQFSFTWTRVGLNAVITGVQKTAHKGGGHTLTAAAAFAPASVVTDACGSKYPHGAWPLDAHATVVAEGVIN